MADFMQMIRGMKDPTDAIFLSEALTDEDRTMAQAIFQTNMPRMKRLLKQEGLFSEVKEKELANRLSLAIKSILAHNLRKKRQPGGI